MLLSNKHVNFDHFCRIPIQLKDWVFSLNNALNLFIMILYNFGRVDKKIFKKKTCYNMYVYFYETIIDCKYK